MINAKVGERVVSEHRDRFRGSTTLTFLVVIKVTPSRVTTDDGSVWVRATGVRYGLGLRGRVRDERPDDVAIAEADERRRRVEHALYIANKWVRCITDEEVDQLGRVLEQITTRLERIGQ